MNEAVTAHGVGGGGGAGEGRPRAEPDEGRLERRSFKSFQISPWDGCCHAARRGYTVLAGMGSLPLPVMGPPR